MIYLQIQRDSPFAEQGHGMKNCLSAQLRYLIGVGEADTGLQKYVTWRARLPLKQSHVKWAICSISWGDSSCDATLAAWPRITVGWGGILFPVVFLCSAVLLLLSSTRNYWLAFRKEGRNPIQAGPWCHLKVMSISTLVLPRIASERAVTTLLPHQWPPVPAASLCEDPQSCKLWVWLVC